MTSDLERACKCHKFLGVFALDKLPPILPSGSSFIVNTQTSNLSGK